MTSVRLLCPVDILQLIGQQLKGGAILRKRLWMAFSRAINPQVGNSAVAHPSPIITTIELYIGSP